MATPDRVALRPSCPDDWMWHEGLVRKIPGRREEVALPSIEAISEAHAATRDGADATVRQV
eukprot:2700015-Pyramimonas_sp.AAC.1